MELPARTHPAFSRLLAGVSAAALVTGIALFAASRPAHSTGGPIPVAITNSTLAVTDAAAARQAVTGERTFNGDIFSSPFGVVYTVPADKRLVIETVSMHSAIGDANRYNVIFDTREGGKSNQAFFTLVPNGARYSALTQPLRLYADPGTQVVVFTINTGNNAPFTVFTFSGHLVDL